MNWFLRQLRCALLCDSCKPHLARVERDNKRLRDELEASQRAGRYAHTLFVRDLERAVKARAS